MKKLRQPLDYEKKLTPAQDAVLTALSFIAVVMLLAWGGQELIEAVLIAARSLP